MKLSLSFSSGHGGLSLIETSFSDIRTGTPLRCVRGNTGGAFGGGTFKWSNAVHAMSLLLLKYAASQGKGDIPSLTGEGGSAAVSLDYAITKQPAWMLDMFGVESGGRPVVRTLFVRSNPERKRPGPVVVSVNRRKLEPGDIEVQLDGRRIEPGFLSALAASLEAAWKPHDSSAGKAGSIASLPFPENSGNRSDSFFEKLVAWFIEEIRLTLMETRIFSKVELHASVAALNKSEQMQNLAGKEIVPSELDRMQDPARMLGFDSQKIELPPLRIALAFVQPAALAIFRYLKFYRGYSLDLDFLQTGTQNIQEQILKNGEGAGFDACILGAATGAIVFSRSKAFVPEMIMPRGTQRLLQKRSAASGIKSDECYLYYHEQPSNPELFFEELAARGVTSKRKAGRFDFHNLDIMRTLGDSSESLRSIFCFPFYRFAEEFVSCDVVATDSRISDKETLLFVRASMLSGGTDSLAHKLNVLIRDAWLSLVEDRALLEKITREMLVDKDYVRAIIRFSGLSLLPNATQQVDEWWTKAV